MLDATAFLAQLALNQAVNQGDDEDDDEKHRAERDDEQAYRRAHRRVDDALPVRLHGKRGLFGERDEGTVAWRRLDVEGEVVVDGAADDKRDFCRRAAEDGGSEVLAEPGDVLGEHGERVIAAPPAGEHAQPVEDGAEEDGEQQPGEATPDEADAAADGGENRGIGLRFRGRCAVVGGAVACVSHHSASISAACPCMKASLSSSRR